MVGLSLPKRILFFAFEGGTGIGHLRRVACIAGALQQHFACLIVTGHRKIAEWFVSPECEYVHIPAWDSLLPAKAAYWNRQPFLPLSVSAAVRMRKTIIQGVVDSYAPDLIVVDHLPLGMHEELEDVLRNTPCKKYFITRGILNVSGGLLDLVLGERARQYLQSFYDRIIVAADKRVIDFVEEYALSTKLASKTVQIGYVIERINEEDIRVFRAHRRVNGDAPWVVVSAGGGQLGENLIRRAIELSGLHKDVWFDVVVGPRSNLSDSIGRDIRRTCNLRIHADAHDLPMMHASADIVVCSGGYNSLLEALQGRAGILCVPNWKDPRDEQTYHSKCLKKFAQIEIVPKVERLDDRLISMLGRAFGDKADDRRSELNLSGVDAIKELVFADLG